MLDIPKNECNSIEDGWRNLRNAIIQEAMDDYKAMITGKMKQTYENNIRKIERFFSSDYCKNLLVDIDLTGDDILRELHGFRDEYYDSMARKKKGARALQKPK